MEWDFETIRKKEFIKKLGVRSEEWRCAATELKSGAIMIEQYEPIGVNIFVDKDDRR